MKPIWSDRTWFYFEIKSLDSLGSQKVLGEKQMVTNKPVNTKEKEISRAGRAAWSGFTLSKLSMSNVHLHSNCSFFQNYFCQTLDHHCILKKILSEHIQIWNYRSYSFLVSQLASREKLSSGERWRHSFQPMENVRRAQARQFCESLLR